MSVGSLAAADSGILADQTMLDTIGNNIANVDTTGYKQTTVQFSDLLNQQLAPAGAPVPGLASTNPSAVGSGVQVAAIDTNFAEGSITQTGVPSDVALSGPGFFVVSRNGAQTYTRAGNFHLDANGTLATSNGGEVQGWTAPPGGGTITTSGPTGPLVIHTGATLPPVATTTVGLGGNLPSGSTSPVTATFTVYDSLGRAVPVTLTFTPPASGSGSSTWSLQGTAGTSTTPLWSTPPRIVFGSNGQISSVSGATGSATTGWTLPVTTSPTGGTLDITLPAAKTSDAVTQFAGAQTIAETTQNGSPSGTLESYAVGPSGLVTGTFSDGHTAALGQIAVANFANPGGLTSLGKLSYQASASSGQPVIGVAGANATGTLVGGALEGSNVDLAGQLTDLITAQTAYQANTKVVGTTATVLQSLINMP